LLQYKNKPFTFTIKGYNQPKIVFIIAVIRVGKHLSGAFPVKNSLKQEDALSPLLFNFALEYAIRKV
jgi:hypothetical protein